MLRLLQKSRSRFLLLVCMALLLMCSRTLPCAAQVIKDRSSGTVVPTGAAAQSPLPAPGGPYKVGRTEFDWVDTSRPDPDSPGGYREIVVWLWYPASPESEAEAAEWMPGKWGELLLPWYLSKLKSAETFEAFFGEYLKGSHSPLLRGPSTEYPEITFETNKK